MPEPASISNSDRPSFGSAGWWLAPDRKNLTHHFKVFAFLTAWLTIPVFLVGLVPRAAVFNPQIYQAETVPVAPSFPAKTAFDFQVKLKGIQGKVAEKIPLFVKAEGLQGQYSAVFKPAAVGQDENDPELFRGRLEFDQEFQDDPERLYTFWLKGPAHLQRRFDGVALTAGQVLDFTAKPLLPGDLPLPETGQDDRVDSVDRDYLWSVLAKISAGRPAGAAEIAACDLNKDGKITAQDFSLLIDTGVGKEGER